MQKLLIATTNLAKLEEIQDCLSDLPFTCIGLKDIGIAQKVEETGSTFEENAILKAKTYAKLSGLPTLADDGGLEIDALNGEPGVHSHRWIHKDREDEDEELIQHVIERMKRIPKNKRGAQLRVVIALALSHGNVHTSEGVIRGIIAPKPSSYRRKGFPYRSLLYLPELKKYYNHDELSKEENKAYNHRRKALEKLKPIILKIINE
ncbi:MAG: Non-canonical purine NTP pyrophosphatase [Candidatus Gottesmanbacteria bacterium GW2011_GWA2_44_17]|uniref:Non-canonical purine NTP pyrophosphatase n=2 Tax=Candidatus Gottesmaniibacteriota TaxID=1752720 RepID=A0A0G1HJ80_9BACT|nr:MAG: Non-canonical purine NTP pyrophosphatase [Microgenomates group bacterium GW2011_GWC1_43_11]KKT37381.1 MAG: Non-canonical purine NTP pyrophosphatase [Candidatus Gottesmanbacteria bacterium GW2011_GWB1_44_11c]KKT47271.1 MAG: Non-canonical purine NTP pyrophosphatase [Candidatus Gottesmanbacteria bacterium GW2011_GWA2_44_17]HCM82750.1 non-canonical purine NTP pyrophosphatase [Patescibacteria group bacterium]